MKKIFFIDPMSYSNLQLYDDNLLTNIESKNIEFFASDQYNGTFKRVRKIFSYSRKRGLLKATSYILSTIQIFFYALFFRAKLIHFQWLKLYWWDYALLYMLRIRGAKILLTAHNILPHENPKRYFNIHKRIYKIVDLIIVHTENTKLEMIDLFSLSAEKIKVIKHGVFELDYSEIAIADGEKKEIQQIYSKKKKVISFLGRLSQQKGINLTIDFLRLHSHEYPEYTFVIAGAGHVPKLKDIERLDNVVIFNKELSDRMFAKLIELSSFILLPYKKTSQSGLLLTSIGAQKPVITTRLPNFLEAFKISNMGILIEQADINGLKQAVDSSLEFDPTDINWNKLKNYYSWSEIGKQYDQLYKSSGSISDNKL